MKIEFTIRTAIREHSHWVFCSRRDLDTSNSDLGWIARWRDAGFVLVGPKANVFVPFSAIAEIEMQEIDEGEGE